MKKQILEKFEELELKKSNLVTISGGTSTTLYKQVGYTENEYEDLDGDGKLSEEELKQKPIIMQVPNG